VGRFTQVTFARRWESRKKKNGEARVSGWAGGIPRVFRGQGSNRNLEFRLDVQDGIHSSKTLPN